jgi:hypothetical protein
LGSFPVTVNLTDETITEWETLITAYENRGNKYMWFEVWSPYLEKGFFIIAQPPKVIPMPEQGQNSLMTVEINLIIDTYKGLNTKVEPT